MFKISVKILDVHKLITDFRLENHKIKVVKFTLSGDLIILKLFLLLNISKLNNSKTGAGNLLRNKNCVDHNHNTKAYLKYFPDNFNV